MLRQDEAPDREARKPCDSCRTLGKLRYYHYTTPAQGISEALPDHHRYRSTPIIDHLATLKNTTPHFRRSHWCSLRPNNLHAVFGKLGYYHYTTPAKVAILCATALGFNHSGKRANVQPRSSTRLNADSQDECEYGILLNSIILFPCCVILIALLKGVGSAEMGLSSYND